MSAKIGFEWGVKVIKAGGVCVTEGCLVTEHPIVVISGAIPGSLLLEVEEKGGYKISECIVMSDEEFQRRALANQAGG